MPEHNTNQINATDQYINTYLICILMVGRHLILNESIDIFQSILEDSLSKEEDNLSICFLIHVAALGTQKTCRIFNIATQGL